MKAEHPFSHLTYLGKIQPRSSVNICASHLSVGMETLDREMFDPQWTYPLLAELGVKWARLQTGWSRTEKEKGYFDFSWLDQVVDALIAMGIQPFFNVGYGNRLWNPDSPTQDAVGWHPMHYEDTKAAWLRYIAALVDHFAERVTYYEIWNEPDIPTFWKPQAPDPALYTALVKLTAPVIRQRQPSAKILGGVMANGHKPQGLDFLEGCLESGMADYIDGISFHPYEQVPEMGNGKGFAALRALLDQVKPELEWWQSEGGWPTQTGGWGQGMARKTTTESIQAIWLLRLIMRDLGAGLDVTSYFHLTDFREYVLDGSRGQPQFFGLLRGVEHTPKPSYFAYQCLCAIFDGDTVVDRAVMLRRFMKAGGNFFDVPGLLTTCQSAGFRRNDTPIIAFWYPADEAQGQWTATAVDIEIWYPASLHLNDPVVVNPLTQSVYEIEVSRSGDKVRLVKNLPLMDYPVLLCDRSIIQIIGE